MTLYSMRYFVYTMIMNTTPLIAQHAAQAALNITLQSGTVLTVLTCLRCNSDWVQRGTKLPVACAKCHSVYWNVPKRLPKPEFELTPHQRAQRKSRNKISRMRKLSIEQRQIEASVEDAARIAKQHTKKARHAAAQRKYMQAQRDKAALALNTAAQLSLKTPFYSPHAVYIAPEDMPDFSQTIIPLRNNDIDTIPQLNKESNENSHIQQTAEAAPAPVDPT